MKGYLPVKFGARLRRNACTPSAKSSVSPSSAWAAASSASCSASVRGSSMLKTALMRWNAWVGPVAKRRAMEAGASAYYTKPFSPTALLKEMESLPARMSAKLPAKG